MKKGKTLIIKIMNSGAALIPSGNPAIVARVRNSENKSEEVILVAVALLYC